MNAKDYEWAIAQAFISGVQPCFRGKRVYANEAQKQIVTYWVDIYKRYIELFTGNTVHVKAPEMDPNNAKRTTGMDVIMQANSKSQTTEKGFVAVFNLTDEARTEHIRVPMYYTGLTSLTEAPMPVPGSSPADNPLPSYATPPYLPVENDVPTAYDSVTGYNGQADIHLEGKVEGQNIKIDSNGNAYVDITLEPMSYTWFTISEAGATVDAPLFYPANTTNPSTDDPSGIMTPPEIPVEGYGQKVLADSQEFTYVGNWSDTTKNTGIDRTTIEADSSMSFTFNSDKVALYGAKSPKAGLVDVYIDDIYTGSINLYNQVRKLNTLLLKIEDLPAADHTVKLINAEDKELQIGGIVLRDQSRLMKLTIEGQEEKVVMEQGDAFTYALTPYDNSVNLDDGTLFTMELAGIVTLDTANKTLTLANDPPSTTEITIKAMGRVNNKTLSSNPVTIIAVSSSDNKWLDLTDTGGQWTFINDGKMIAPASGRDQYLLLKYRDKETIGTLKARMSLKGNRGIGLGGFVVGVGNKGGQDFDATKQQGYQIYLTKEQVIVAKSGTGILASAAHNQDINSWIPLKTVFQNGSIKVYIGEELMITYTNQVNIVANSRVGLYTGIWPYSNQATSPKFRSVSYTPQQ